MAHERYTVGQEIRFRLPHWSAHRVGQFLGYSGEGSGKLLVSSNGKIHFVWPEDTEPRTPEGCRQDDHLAP